MTQEEENEVPTAEEFLMREDLPIDFLSGDDVNFAMIEFAKLHVQAALEAASYGAKLASYDNKANKPGTSGFTTMTVNDVEWRPCSESILNAYPLENVK
jgi:hypothetical protein